MSKDIIKGTKAFKFTLRSLCKDQEISLSIPNEYQMSLMPIFFHHVYMESLAAYDEQSLSLYLKAKQSPTRV